VAANHRLMRRVPQNRPPAPLEAVENAIWAANEQDYEKANPLLDISELAQSSTSEGVIEHWDWMRVTSIEIEEEETNEEARRLFITLQNDNYPTQNVGYWIWWQDERWVALKERN
jgi:hypothetical protein